MTSSSLALLRVIAATGFPLALLACGEVSHDEPKGERPIEGTGGASGSVSNDPPVLPEDCGNVVRFGASGLSESESYGFQGTFDGAPATLTGSDGGPPVLGFLLLLGGKFLGAGLSFVMENSPFQGGVEVSSNLDSKPCDFSAWLLAQPPVHDGTWGSYSGTGFLHSTTDLSTDETGIARGDLHVEFRDVEDPSRAPHLLDGSFALQAQVVHP